MTFHSDGPFKTEQDLHFLSEKMTKPDDFMVRNLPPMSRPVGISGVMLNLKKVKIRGELEKKRFSASQTEMLDIIKMYPINSQFFTWLSPRP